MLLEFEADLSWLLDVYESSIESEVSWLIFYRVEAFKIIERVASPLVAVVSLLLVHVLPLKVDVKSIYHER